MRYNAYKTRAVFYNVTGRTVAGLSGQVFKQEPITVLPNELNALIGDVDGGGVSLNQQSKKTLAEVVSFSRAGLFVDFPDTGGAPITKAQMSEGKIRPSIILYRPEAIINWRTRQVGGVHVLSLVVLREEEVIDDDGFEENTETQFRVLRLDEENMYRVEIYRLDEDTKDFEIVDEYEPSNSKGQRFEYIPFTFVGSVNNDPDPDRPLMIDMADLNIAHYRNSADHEESSYVVGQPTPYAAGLSREWVDEVMEGTIYLGSRAAMLLPEGGSAGLLQADPNTMPGEAMKHKEEQMAKLGAKLLDVSNVEKTATQVLIKDFGEHANLTTVSVNVSKAYEMALGFAYDFVGTGEPEIKYVLNTDFEVNKLNANELAALVQTWQSGAIVEEELRDTLRKGGVATLEYEDFKNKRDSEGPPPPWAMGAAGADQNLLQE